MVRNSQFNKRKNRLVLAARMNRIFKQLIIHGQIEAWRAILNAKIIQLANKRDSEISIDVVLEKILDEKARFIKFRESCKILSKRIYGLIGDRINKRNSRIHKNTKKLKGHGRFGSFYTIRGN